MQPGRAAIKYAGARAKSAGRPAPRWADQADSSPDASARGSEGQDITASASTDPFPLNAKAEDGQLETEVKKMDRDIFWALSRLAQQGYLAEAYKEIVHGELRRRGLAVTHGLGPLPMKDEEGESSSGRPPSY